jgi:hypothetical protein
MFVGKYALQRRDLIVWWFVSVCNCILLAICRHSGGGGQAEELQESM